VDAQCQEEDQRYEDGAARPQAERCALVAFIAAFIHGDRMFSSFHRYVLILSFAA